jgi:hypothetical protein
MTQVQPMAPPPQYQTYPPYRRGPVGGPSFPYQPETFSQIYLWWAILFGAGLLTAVILIGFAALIAAAVLHAVLMFKSWNQIQDGNQRTSPGLAVGLCYIPFFHFYWWFVNYYGFAQDANAYLRRYKIPGPPVSEGLALTYCILRVCCIIPYLNVPVLLAVFVIDFILMHQVKTTSIAIATWKLNAASTPAAGPVY